MIENPLHEQLAAAGDLSPADFAAALAACPVSPAEDQDLIPLGDFAPDEYQLLPAGGFALDAAGIFPGAGFYMIEEEAGRKAYRFAGGAAFSQILLPVTLEGAARARIALKHVFDPAVAEGTLAFLNGVRVALSVIRENNQPAALIVDIPGSEIVEGQAAILTLVPPGHIEIEGGTRQVAFAVTRLEMEEADADRLAAARAAGALYAPGPDDTPRDLRVEWEKLAQDLADAG